MTLPPLEDLDEASEHYAAACRGADETRRRELRDGLITFCLPFAGRLAGRFRRRGETTEDLEQVARLGLIKAVDRYDPARGSFTAYAVLTITGELKRHFRDHTSGVHVPRPDQELTLRVRAARGDLLQQLGREPTAAEIGDRLGVPARDVLGSEVAARAHSPASLNQMVTAAGELERGDLVGEIDPDLQLVDERVTLRHLLGRLPDRERAVLTLRFHGNYSQKEVAERLGISQMHVSRLQQRALSWLRAAMLSDTPPAWTGRDETDHRVTVTIEAGRNSANAYVFGEIDRDNADHLRRRLLDAVAEQATGQTLRIELTEVPLLDAAGVAALMAVGEAGRAHGIVVRVCGLQLLPARILAVCGAQHLLA
jgi:RNA polymerase sigma-B factor